MCAINVCLVQLQDMHDMLEKRPSEQFAVRFLQTNSIYLKKKRVNFTQERVLLSLNRTYDQS